MSSDVRWPQQHQEAAALLLKAAEFSEALRCSAWNFAVEITELVALGLSRTDLRWLVCHGLLEHGVEILRKLPDGRLFDFRGKMTFYNRTCFVLTPAGLSAAGMLISHATRDCKVFRHAKAADHPNTEGEGTVAECLVGVKPAWNCVLRRLSLGQFVVKEYRTPAPNQQVILAVFQEEDWPLRIDDPLPRKADLEPKRRLHETVSALNRRQSTPLLRFSVDGCGCGVRWSLVARSTVNKTASMSLAEDRL